MRRVQRELKEWIQQGKDSYKRKLEHKVQQNNLKDVWSSMRSIPGYKPSVSQPIGGGTERTNELNLFFNRFERTLKGGLRTTPPPAPLQLSTSKPPALLPPLPLSSFLTMPYLSSTPHHYLSPPPSTHTADRPSLQSS